MRVVQLSEADIDILKSKLKWSEDVVPDEVGEALCSSSSDHSAQSEPCLTQSFSHHKCSAGVCSIAVRQHATRSRAAAAHIFHSRPVADWITCQ